MLPAEPTAEAQPTVSTSRIVHLKGPRDGRITAAECSCLGGTEVAIIRYKSLADKPIFMPNATRPAVEFI